MNEDVSDQELKESVPLTAFDIGYTRKGPPACNTVRRNSDP